MKAKIIDGKAYAERLRSRIAAAVAELKSRSGLTPGLAVVLVGEDPASQVYVRNKHKQTLEAGMNSWEHRLPASTSQDDLLKLVGRLGEDRSVHGILVQLPLPKQIDSHKILNAVNPDKDVDGFHVINAGRLVTGQDSLVPCTPLGCVLLAKDTLQRLEGLEAVVVGRSNIVGKPVAQLLLAENATVTIAHSRTRDLPGVCRRADLVIAAVGRPEMIKGDWIKPGACVIDVGINRIERDGKTRLVGDCEFESCARIAGAITPVPGGVGPMTIACLLRNTVTAACRQAGVAVPETLAAS
ncbi:MAG TPA: bifunctional methylenetetrahydrofolate dehydrogenase/methenyltetrahydrofolate cyclohydrolase FolD [Aestuariivirgaceae bacterium]|nr:bifunctional methylenetetrahydrofolate dehydrogenase/methenyltetrahydrofolate cyclohydrolase FolD [Aestuariivirgaceae bacterium]